MNVLHKATFADADWEKIGQQLSIKHHVLKTIRADHPGQSSLCMSYTISQWLNNDLEPSWEKLAEAVSKVEGYGEAIAKIVWQKGIVHTGMFCLMSVCCEMQFHKDKWSVGESDQVRMCHFQFQVADSRNSMFALLFFFANLHFIKPAL